MVGLGKGIPAPGMGLVVGCYLLQSRKTVGGGGSHMLHSMAKNTGHKNHQDLDTDVGGEGKTQGLISEVLSWGFL